MCQFTSNFPKILFSILQALQVNYRLKRLTSWVMILVLSLMTFGLLQGTQVAQAQGPNDPTSIDNTLLLWLQDDQVYTDENCTIQASDGDDVACWKDMSGNAAHVTQPDPNRRPVYIEDFINGAGTLDFDIISSQEDFMEHTLEHGMIISFTIFIALQSDNEMPSQYQAFFASTPSFFEGDPSDRIGMQIDYGPDPSGDQVFRFRDPRDPEVSFGEFEPHSLKLYTANKEGRDLRVYSDGELIDSPNVSDINSS